MNQQPGKPYTPPPVTPDQPSLVLDPSGQDPNKPIAYDVHGRPLYAAPPVNLDPGVRNDIGQQSSHVTNAPDHSGGQNFDPKLRAQLANEPHVVHASRPVDPKEIPMSAEVQRLHDESRRLYPHLNISGGEFVILDIKRHPIGLLLPIGATAFITIILIFVLILYPTSGSDGTGVALPAFGLVVGPVILFMLLVGIGGFIAVWVYLQNQFYMTNESVIQEIQHSLFARHEQTVSLGSIEDASYKQNGLLQTFLNYGTIRLSTEGEETTYRFSFVSDPRAQVAILNNAIEAFKNGRPVDPFEN